jgi:hypothetical protein
MPDPLRTDITRPASAELMFFVVVLAVDRSPLLGSFEPAAADRYQRIYRRAGTSEATMIYVADANDPTRAPSSTYSPESKSTTY